MEVFSMTITSGVLEGLFDELKVKEDKELEGMKDTMIALLGSKRLGTVAINAGIETVLGGTGKLQALLAIVFVMGRNYQRGLDESEGLLGIKEG
jgi:hypothetical protein